MVQWLKITTFLLDFAQVYSKYVQVSSLSTFNHHYQHYRATRSACSSTKTAVCTFQSSRRIFISHANLENDSLPQIHAYYLQLNLQIINN